LQCRKKWPFILVNPDETLSKVESVAWTALKAVTTKFFFFSEVLRLKILSLVELLLITYKYIVCKVSLKVRFTDSHLKFVTTNWASVSDEHWKHFHQEIWTTGK
jgi:hypothetical protein